MITKRLLIFCLLTALFFFGNNSVAQEIEQLDSADVSEVKLAEIQQLLLQTEQLRIADSLRKAELEAQINLLKENEELKREQLKQQLLALQNEDSVRRIERTKQIEEMKKTAIGHPVFPFSDTLFYIYSKYGSLRPAERAALINRKIKHLYEDDFLIIDSIKLARTEKSIEIVYNDVIIMTVSDVDAIWNATEMNELANKYLELIKSSIEKERKENSLATLLLRLLLVAIIIICMYFLVRIILKLYKKSLKFIIQNKDKWFKGISYKTYNFLSAKQELVWSVKLLNAINLAVIGFVLYLTIPLVFSIFPFTRGWASYMFGLIWSPFRSVFIAVWDYLPNLITIIVILVIMRYVAKFIKYLFGEVDAGRLEIKGFHSDWAMPTYSIVRFLLYAFTFVLVFPYLPGSDSNIFRGVSVFIGVLFSLGSSTAIANMVAGLVITYMRPFKIGDRIKIGDMTGDVIEKTLLVTRLRTVRNEEITIPNSAVLSGNTINYSAFSKSSGLILQTTVTIGYDVPWQKMHKALILAADRVSTVMKHPKPFVLQTSLDDFYVAYQLNAFTQEANRQARVLSDSHSAIQDVCAEEGIEILSPHYRAARDGNMITIPPDYLPSDYQPPAFNVSLHKNDNND